MKCPKCGNVDFYDIDYIESYDSDYVDGVEKITRLVNATCTCGQDLWVREIFTFTEAVLTK